MASAFLILHGLAAGRGRATGSAGWPSGSRAAGAARCSSRTCPTPTRPSPDGVAPRAARASSRAGSTATSASSSATRWRASLWLREAAGSPSRAASTASRSSRRRRPAPALAGARAASSRSPAPTRRRRRARPRHTRLVCADDDPYCPEGAARRSTARRSDLADRPACPARGHLNVDAGFGPWPERRPGPGTRPRCRRSAGRRTASRRSARPSPGSTATIRLPATPGARPTCSAPHSAAPQRDARTARPRARAARRAVSIASSSGTGDDLVEHARG